MSSCDLVASSGGEGRLWWLDLWQKLWSRDEQGQRGEVICSGGPPHAARSKSRIFAAPSD